MLKLLYAATVFTSAFLLFLIQPMVSKHILPWFGGSAAVWATCLVFFQTVLLAGYAYADWTTRRLRPIRQVSVHAILLVVSAATLGVLADASWKPTGAEDPTLRILGLLAASVGLPYFVLSTTGPLLQSWVARSLADTSVYRFFSLSNLASLAGLMAYPFLIEPRAILAEQAYGWSAVYLLFTLFCLFSAGGFARRANSAAGLLDASGVSESGAGAPSSAVEVPAPTLRRQLLWLSLSAIGSWLLLAITNHITQNIAAIPFLWLLPLTVYLFTFVLCFESDRWYRRSWALPVTGLVLAACAHGLSEGALGFDLWVAIPLYVGGLLLMCMFAHGELAGLRPAPRYLTRFYLMLSAGGALGGVAVALIAPRVLPAYYELGLGFVIIALLAVAVLWERRALALTAALLALFCAYNLALQVKDDFTGSRQVLRSFYGTLMTLDTDDEKPEDRVRQLYHGAVKHGEQFLDPARRREPTAYYGPDAGIGLAIANTRVDAKRVGLIGVGAGTLAVYGKAGDTYRFYEINPQVNELAKSEFTFFGDSAAKIDLVLGDARLSLEKETPQQFDVLAVDAFSGDSVPVHLITRQAMALYTRHLAPGGIVAFHVTNQFLALAPVVQRIAQAHGLHAVQIHNVPDSGRLRTTDWVLVARDAAQLQQAAFRKDAVPIADNKGLGVWTDDFNNLFEVLKR